MSVGYKQLHHFLATVYGQTLDADSALMSSVDVTVKLQEAERILEHIGIEESRRSQIMADIRQLEGLDGTKWDVILKFHGKEASTSIAVIKEDVDECTLMFESDEDVVTKIRAVIWP